MQTMSVSHPARERRKKVLGIMIAAALFSGPLSSVAASAQSNAPTSANPAAVPVRPLETTSPPVALRPEEQQRRQKREEWEQAMQQTPLPKKGCFEAYYPNKEWREVPCTTAPPYPQLPRRGRSVLIVGNGNNASPQAPTGLISTAIGSFDSVTGVTSESGQINATGPMVADAYTLQLNTNFFTNAGTACPGSPNPACQGWEQFVFANNGTSGSVFIQYWMLQYNTTCPAGWNPFSFPGSTDIYCFRNSTNASGVPNQPISNLVNLKLSGTVSMGSDSYFFSAGGGTVATASGDNSVNAAAGWNIAEFAVVGNAGGGQANFNNGSTIATRTRIVYGGTDKPNCVAAGFTGETNNLSFAPPAPSASQPGPALISNTSSAGGALSDCAAATAVALSDDDQTPMLYRAKFVCGQPVGLAIGRYFTVINVHNPIEDASAKPVSFTMKVAVAPPNQGHTQFGSSIVVASDEVREISCVDIIREANGANLCSASSCEGFVVIESQAELDVTAIYSAANTTSPQQVTTLHTDRVLPHCPIRTEVLPEQTVLFVPPKVGGGDADYAGHGPCVDFRLALRLEDGNKTLAAHYRMHAFECDSSFETPRSDFTTAKGEEELILMVASPRGRILGYNVNSTKSQRYIDTNHSNDDFDYSDPTNPLLFDPVSPVKKLSFVGDTAGDEAGTKTGAFITFPAMRVELETCTPARPTAQSLTAPSRP